MLTYTPGTFAEKIIRCFNGEGGGIGFYGYSGDGGKLYERWLAENHLYRSEVILPEMELILAFSEKICGFRSNIRNFLQIGAFNSRLAYLTKILPILSLLADPNKIQYTIAEGDPSIFREQANLISEYSRNTIVENWGVIFIIH